MADIKKSATKPKVRSKGKGTSKKISPKASPKVPSKKNASQSKPSRFRTKYIRDPIHDLISIDDPLVLKILDTQPMQRLKNIRQLGLASVVYPGAEHTRFSHSLGAYHLSKQVLDQLIREGAEIEERSIKVVRMAALLHDTGHGPFSHLFESVLKKAGFGDHAKHEFWTKEIIMKGEIRHLLDTVDADFAQHVKDVISNTFKPHYLSSVVSSQFDVDRFDYMLRDSLMTGVQYGNFDLKWMLRSLSVREVQTQEEDSIGESDKRIVVDVVRGLSSLETYQLGNFYLYGHVYYHKTIQSAECMLKTILSRALKVIENSDDKGRFHPVLVKISTESTILLDEYLSLSDWVVLSWINKWAVYEEDAVLKDLSNRFKKRNLFKVRNVRNLGKKAYSQAIDDIKSALNQQGLNPEYYLIEKELQRDAYNEKKLDEAIYVVEHKNEVKLLSEVKEKNISKAIRETNIDETLVIVPKEIEGELDTILERYEK